MHKKTTLAHLCISSKESVWNGYVYVKFQAANDSALHCNKLLLLVGIITDVDEIIQAGWVSLLISNKGFCCFCIFIVCKKVFQEKKLDYDILMP